jgi:hypothetical protein
MCSSLQVLYLIEGEAEDSGFVPFFLQVLHFWSRPSSVARCKKSIKWDQITDPFTHKNVVANFAKSQVSCAYHRQLIRHETFYVYVVAFVLYTVDMFNSTVTFLSFFNFVLWKFLSFLYCRVSPITPIHASGKYAFAIELHFRDWDVILM